MGGTRDRTFSRAGSMGPMANLGASRRATRATQIDPSDFNNLRKMTIGLNEMRREDLQNKKIEKVIIGGSETQRILYTLVPNSRQQSWFGAGL